MITIDYVEKKDKSKYITITNSADSKNKNAIQIDLSKPSDWNKQNINNFIIRTVSLAEDKLELPKLTESAKKQIDEKSDVAESIKFINELFTEFVKKYNEK